MSQHNQQWVFNEGTITDSLHEVIRRESVQRSDGFSPNYSMGTFHEYMPAPATEEIEMQNLAPVIPIRLPTTQLSGSLEVSRTFTLTWIT